MKLLIFQCLYLVKVNKMSSWKDFSINILTNTLLEQEVFVCFLALTIGGKDFTIINCDVYKEFYLARF